MVVVVVAQYGCMDARLQRAQNYHYFTNWRSFVLSIIYCIKLPLIIYLLLIVVPPPWSP